MTTPSADWQEAYFEISSADQRYQKVLDVLPPSSGIDDEVLTAAVADVGRLLLTANAMDEQLKFLEQVNDHRPGIYAEFAPVYEIQTIRKKLFFGELEQAQARFNDHLADLMQEPVFVASVLDSFTFYGHPEVSAELAAKVLANYQPDEEDDEAFDLVEVCREHVVAMAVQRFLAGEHLDQAQLFADLKASGVEDPMTLSDDMLASAEKMTSLKQVMRQIDPEEFDFLPLQLAFNQHLLKTAGLPVYLSSRLLAEVVVVLDIAHGEQPEKMAPNEFFHFEEHHLEDYLIESAFNQSEESGPAMLAAGGLSYVYDFLLAQGLVDQTLHAHVLQLQQSLREEVLDDRISFFNLGYLQQWPKADSVSETAYQNLKQQIQASWHTRLPLAEIPVEEDDEFAIGQLFGMSQDELSGFYEEFEREGSQEEDE